MLSHLQGKPEAENQQVTIEPQIFVIWKKSS